MPAKLKIDQGDWVIVCDGKKALWLENAGDAVFPNLKTRDVAEHAVAAARDLGSDAPGRVFQSVGERRSAVDQTDPHEDSERRFIEDLAKRLDAAVMAGQAKSVVVVAPPRALGILRQAYSPRVRQALRAEIDKDFVRMPVHEIERHLVG
jgi:protein required for attachment to host cells